MLAAAWPFKGYCTISMYIQSNIKAISKPLVQLPSAAYKNIAGLGALQTFSKARSAGKADNYCTGGQCTTKFGSTAMELAKCKA